MTVDLLLTRPGLPVSVSVAAVPYAGSGLRLAETPDGSPLTLRSMPWL